MTEESETVERLIAQLVRERDEMSRNLTSAQERCTALLLEVRELRRELAERSRC